MIPMVREAAHLGRGSPLRILVIAERPLETDQVRALQAALPHAEVSSATGVADGLLRLKNDRYDAVLTDADDPMAVQALRAADEHAAVLVHSDDAVSATAMRALSAGAQECFVNGEIGGSQLATAVLHAVQRQRASEQIRRRLQLSRELLDALDAPTCAVGADSVIVAINEAWRRFMTTNGGRSEACGEGINYLAVCDVVPIGTPDHLSATDVASGVRQVLAGRLDRYQHEYPCHGPNVERWFSVRIAPAQVDGNRGAVISHVDITAMHFVQQALTHQALHDALTGLPNRVLLADRLEQGLHDAGRRGSGVGVAFVDLDHFKRINDSLGHAAGDALLVQVAQRLRLQMRAGDTLSRFSGDEFVVVWRDVASRELGMTLGRRVVACMQEPFTLRSTAVNVSASVGVVVGCADESPDDLVQAADAAMYDAKRHGRGQVRIYSRELRRGVHERMSIEVGLRGALARSELVVHYQPVMDLTSGHAVAVEALVRWQSPDQGLLGPNRFISVAESSGLIVPLGAWVLEQACRDAVAMTGLAEGLDVAVNFSVKQLTHPEALTHVRDALRTSGLDPHRLLLEVTESAVMEDEQAASLNLDAMAELGVRIAIDDFGTGYSSLLYLRRYRISALKLDRTFVSGIGTNPADEAICMSVVSLAHAVGATSIAEGIETTSQYAMLRGFGCQQAQGFLWSPAVPVDDLPTVLQRCQDVRLPGAASAPPAAHLDPEITFQIATMHRAGVSLHAIAAALNRRRHSDDDPRWTADSVARRVAASS